MKEYQRKPNTECLICKKKIYKRPKEILNNKNRVFCSMSCYGISCRKEKPCLVCGKPILSGENKKTCSRGCSNKHRTGIKYKINRPRDKVKDLRALKTRLLNAKGKTCEKCGYDVYQILEIHHKDRNRNNNELNNLELLCPNCHTTKHYLKRTIEK